MKRKALKIGSILCAAAIVLFVFYKIAYLTKCIEPEVCTSPIVVDGILDESDWQLKESKFYFESDPQFKTTNFSKFQFLRDAEYLYFGAQFSFDSTLTGYDGGVFIIENARESYIQFQIELSTMKLSAAQQGDIEIEFTLENENKELLSDIDCERRGTPSICDVIEMQQNYTSDKWSIELSIPLEAMLGEKDKIIAFKLEIYGTSYNESRTNVAMDYPYELSFFNKYLVIKQVN